HPPSKLHTPSLHDALPISRGLFKRQTGGRGMYGDATVIFEPMERGGGFEFVNKIVGGSIPKEFVPPIGKGIQKKMESGGRAGYPDRKSTRLNSSHVSISYA